MAPQSFQIVPDLQPHIVEERIVKRGIRRAGKLEIDPEADSEFVAGIQQFVLLVMPPSPETQGIHVAGRRVLDIAPESSFRDAVGKIIRRDPVGSLGKELHPVDFKIHRGIGCFLMNLHHPQPDTAGFRVQKSPLAIQQLHLDRIEGVVPHPDRPPELRMGDRDCRIPLAFLQHAARDAHLHVIKAHGGFTG